MARLRREIAALLLALPGATPAVFAASVAPELPLFRIRSVQFQPDAWRRMLRYFKETGPNGPSFTPGDGYMPATFGFEDIRGNRGEPHRAEYLNLWGYENEGRFAPFEVRLVSEDWRAFKPEYTRDERAKEACAAKICLFVDQWNISLDLDGTKTGSYHGSVIESPTGTVHGGDTFQTTDAEVKAKLETLLTHWSRLLDERFKPRP